MIHSNPSPAYLIWCFIIALVPFKLGAQASSTTLDSSIYYIVEDKYPVQDLSSKVQVLLEENGSIDIGQILSGEYEEAFVPIDTTVYVLSQEQVVWLKLAYSNVLFFIKNASYF